MRVSDAADHDRSLLLCLVALLVGLGVVMVHSASITSRPSEFEQIYLSRHLAFLLFALMAATVCAALPAVFWERAAPWLFVVTLLLLGGLMIPGLGVRVNGACRWLRLGPVSVQPSEIAKITLPLMLCRLLARRRSDLSKPLRGTLPILLPLVLVLPLVLRQPDLGTALFLATVAAIALFVGGWPIWKFAVGLAIAVPLAASQFALRPYQMQRITGFLAAWSDIDAAPYQLRQSLLTLGSGGTFGVGLGKGWQKLSYLPEANTDFVFAVIGEELGLVGTLGLLALWGGFVAAGLRMFRRHAADSFAYAAGVTLLLQLALQATLNAAVATGLVPTKGIPHPLISYGGSSLVVSLVAIGIIVSLSKAAEVDA